MVGSRPYHCDRSGGYRTGTTRDCPVPEASAPAREWLLLGALAALWGSSYLFIRVAVETIPPVTLIAARVTLAALLLSALMLVR